MMKQTTHCFLVVLFATQLFGQQTNAQGQATQATPQSEQGAKETPKKKATETIEQDSKKEKEKAPATEARSTDTRPADQAEKQELMKIEPTWVDALTWRPIGPASMGGRIIDLAVVESDPTTYYVATASGGLFKTINNGTTFSPIFEKQSTVSIGDVCISASDPSIIWVGTGEHNARNSVSWGDGVYKSTDAGRTWQNMGLKKSFQIGRIAIHPTNPNIVYVGALGRLWGRNKQRGLYMTTNGGQSWKRVLYVDAKTGCVDVVMHPRDANTLIVAMYERQRDGFDSNDPAKRWGPGSGIYKTTDGGENWTKLTKGLPEAELGRVGLAYYQANPNTVYAIVESEKIGTGPAAAFMGISGSESPRGTTATLRSVTAGGPAEKAGLQAGDQVVEVDGEEVASYNDLVVKIRSHKPGEKSPIKIKRGDEEVSVELTWGKRSGTAGTRPFTAYLGGQRANASQQQGEKGVHTGGIFKSIDGGETWKRINSLNPRPFYYSQIHIDPSDDRYQYVMGVSLHTSGNGGVEYGTGGRNVHPDHHAMWIDPRDGRHLILGCDGGLYISYDRGKTWDFNNVMDIGQFYDVGLDTRTPFRAYGGMQDNGSWGGPTRKRGSRGPVNADWLRIGGGDGFVCRVDPADPDLVYYESQSGNMGRLNLRTGERARIRPTPPKGTRYRFNWKTPFALSHHNSKIFYCAGNFVFRSLNRGSKLQKISPEITRTDRGSATAIAESPRDPNVLYVGTDDGALWVTKDAGHAWIDITKKVGLPKSYHVSTIEASRFETGRAYVAFDGHRSNNDRPHIYVTEDFGQTWQAIKANLPSGSTRCLREDVSNANLLFLGTEFGIFATLDRGRHWMRIHNNLPTVAIHEIAVHPTENEIVAATHGRSLWVLDVSPLRQMTADIAKAKAHLFKPADGVLWAGALSSANSGHRNFSSQNANFGSAFYYYLSAEAKEVSLEIRDIKGDLIRQLGADKKVGLHRTMWDLRRSLPRRQPTNSAAQAFRQLDTNSDGKLTKEDAAKGQRGQTVLQLIERLDANKDGQLTQEELKARAAPGTSRQPRPGPQIAPGTYLAKLIVDGKELVQEVKVEPDPEFASAMLTEELEAFERKQRAEYIE